MIKLPTLSRYTYIFAFLNLTLLITGLLTLITVLQWRNLINSPVASNSYIYSRLTITNFIVHSGFVISISTFVTAATSLWVFTTRPTREDSKTTGIRVYLIILFITFLITLTSASVVWFSTLRQRSLFTPVWQNLDTHHKVFIQNDLKCCGWFDSTPIGLFSDDLMKGFCANASAMIPDPDPNVTLGCIDPFTHKTDYILNNTFTITYGFTVIQFFLVLTGGAISHLRAQQKRFMRIDHKFNTKQSSFL